MGTGRLGRLLWVFSGPAIIAMASGALYNVVDAAFVGQLGPGPLAAITVVFPAMMMIMAVASGTGVGAASLIARSLGAGDRGQARLTSGNVVLLVLLWGAVTPVLAIPLLDPILRLCGASEDVLPLARSYLLILVATSAITYFAVAINHVIRAEGNAVLPMSAMIVSSLLNIALDPLFIFALGMGVRGAAWATVVGRAAGMVVQLGYLLSRRTMLRPRLEDLRPVPRLWLEIYHVGLATLVRNGVQALILAVATRIAAGFGDLVVAALGVALRLQTFVMMPCFGLSQGYLPLVGYNYGAGKMERVRRVTLLAAGWATGLTTVACVVFVGIPEVVVRPFAPDPELAALAARALRFISLGLAPAGGVILFGAFFQGVGKGLPALVLSSSRQLLFFLPALLVLPRLLDIDGLFLSQPVADFLSLFLAVGWISYQFREMGIPIFSRRAPRSP